MSEKPTYGELEQKVRELEQADSERKQIEEAWREKQNQLLEAQHIAHIGNWWHNLVTGEIYWSDEFLILLD